MSTQLQEDLAEAIIENKSLPRDKRKNKGKLVESVGYSPVTAKAKPTEILEAKGVKDALKARGLTEDLITSSLVHDIVEKPKKRVKELALGAEILGMKKEDKGGNKVLIINITQEAAQKYGINASPIQNPS